MSQIARWEDQLNELKAKSFGVVVNKSNTGDKIPDTVVAVVRLEDIKEVLNPKSYTLEEIAQESAKQANKQNDNDWYLDGEEIARNAAMTALITYKDLQRGHIEKIKDIWTQARDMFPLNYREVFLLQEKITETLTLLETL